MKTIDIETAPLDLEEIKHNKGTEPIDPSGFDLSACTVDELKTRIFNAGGNIPDKRPTKAVLIDHFEKFPDHVEAAREDWVRQQEKERDEKLLEKAAVDPLRGRVLVSPMMDAERPGDFLYYGQGSEREIIKETWGLIANTILSGELVVGWNIRSFDLPFLWRRSLAYGLTVPSRLYDIRGDRFYWHGNFCDLRVLFLGGEWNPGGGKLDHVFRLMGITSKPFQGKFFSEIYAEDPEKAREYCMTEHLGMLELVQRFGINSSRTRRTETRTPEREVVEVVNGWTGVPNSILNLKTISFKAKGLWGCIRSKPSGWKFREERIAADSSEGITSVQAGIQELVAAGLLERKKNGDGTSDYVTRDLKNLKQDSFRKPEEAA